MRVYPAAGLLCRDPVKKDLLPESGRDVDDADPFWHRRLADGDVVLAPVAPTSPPAIAADEPPKTQRLDTGTTRSNDA
jgi:Asp-tRNA(Asn)/Glu-tRNA(Gln) amidotransferase A subunit family amidase